MYRREIDGVLIECVSGNIAHQPDMEAVVNAANAQLRPGGGVAGALHAAAGPGLAEEGRALAPISPGQAVITGGHRLPNRHVIHCLGPVYGRDEPADTLLADCYRNALRLAEEHHVRSVAFPALSTGIFGFPKEKAAPIAVGTVLDALPWLRQVRHIRFVIYSEDDLQLYLRVLKERIP